MTTTTLYIYQSINPATGKKRIRKTPRQNPDYGTIIGTEYRIVADAGKVLTDGVVITSCIDTADPALWTEIDEPQPEPEPEPEPEEQND